MTGKRREKGDSEDERRVARERIFGEPDMQVEVKRAPDLNDPDNYEIPQDGAGVADE